MRIPEKAYIVHGVYISILATLGLLILKTVQRNAGEADVFQAISICLRKADRQVAVSRNTYSKNICAETEAYWNELNLQYYNRSVRTNQNCRVLRAAFNSNKYNWGEKAEQISSLCDSLIAAADADPIILPELQTALWRSSDKANKSGLSHLLALAGKSQCWILQQSLFYNIGWANEQVLLFCYRKIEGSHCGNFDAFFPKAILPLQCPVAGEPFSVKILLGNNGISNEIASEYNHLWVNGTEWHIDPRTGAAPIIFEKPGKHSVHLRVENQCLCNASTPGMVEQIFTVPVR